MPGKQERTRAESTARRTAAAPGVGASASNSCASVTMYRRGHTARMASRAGASAACARRPCAATVPSSSRSFGAASARSASSPTHCCSKHCRRPCASPTSVVAVVAASSAAAVARRVGTARSICRTMFCASHNPASASPAPLSCLTKPSSSRSKGRAAGCCQRSKAAAQAQRSSALSARCSSCDSSRCTERGVAVLLPRPADVSTMAMRRTAQLLCSSATCASTAASPSALSASRATRAA